MGVGRNVQAGGDICIYMTESLHDGLVAKSCPTLAIPWSAARQAPLSMGFSRQEY